MVRFPSGRRPVAPLWSWGVATCLAGVALVFGLATVAPVTLEHNIVGLTIRVAVCSLCTAGFVFAGWRT